MPVTPNLLKNTLTKIGAVDQNKPTKAENLAAEKEVHEAYAEMHFMCRLNKNWYHHLRDSFADMFLNERDEYQKSSLMHTIMRLDGVVQSANHQTEEIRTA